MTPRTDEFDNLSATDDEDDDDDEAFKEDMAALSRACTIASAATDDDAASPSNDHRELVLQSDPLLDSGDALIPLTAGDDSDDDDDPSDLECLKRVQSLYQPLSSLPPLPRPLSLPTTMTGSDDDDEDDFETLRAIRSRFSTYIEGRSLYIPYLIWNFSYQISLFVYFGMLVNGFKENNSTFSKYRIFYFC